MQDQPKKGHLRFVILVLAAVVLVLVFGFRNRAEAPVDGVPAEEGVVATTTDSTALPAATPTTKPAAKPAAKPSTSAPVTSAPAPASDVLTVYYSEQGFSPFTLEVPRGKSVRFVNRSGGAMRLVANNAGGQNPYPGFDQSKTVGPGGIYDFTFTIVGAWGIKNQFDSAHVAAIVVQ